MRPTTGVMLQQNNNNNYPCLNVSGSTREMLQKCSRASLPFPSRLELGLGDLPLIRGLRAWALCSKNRCKAGGLLGGGQAPTAPPNSNRGSSTSCPRPADVYLSEEWGRMGYGLPLGMDARQAGIGALVTVATLKTSEGSGKTQTQCLFLRTEKGSCLYSTAKPGSAASTSTASSVVGGWLRGKTGGRDASTGRSLPAQTGANRVRVRSGRRWRKSGNAASREKTGMSRESHQRSREDPAGERQEVQDKRSLQQDGRRVRPEDDGVCRSPRCCHNVSTKTCDQCGKSVQRRESQDEGEGVPNRLNEDVKGMRKDGDGGLCESSNPDLQSSSSSDGDEIRGDDSSEEIKTQTDNFLDAEVLTDDFKSRHNNRKATEDHSEDVNGFSCVEVDEESEKEMERADVDDEKSVNQIPDESSAPVEGSVCSNDHNARWVETEQDHLEVNPRIMGKEEVDVSRFDLQESNCAANEENTVKPQLFSENEVTEEKEDASSPLRCRDSSTSETHVKNVTENSCDGRTDVVELEEEEEEFTCIELDGGDDDDKQRHQINSCKDEDDEDACSNTSVRETGANASNVGSADPSTLLQISPANPDPSLPPLGSMATGPPCLKEEEEEEEEEEGRLGATAREEEKKRHGRELEEEEEEEERGSTVDTAARREEEEEEEEDEFGVFMQAEGEPAWSMSASVPCGSRESVAVAVTEESTSWTSGWTDASDDSWTAFPQDSSDEGGQDVTGQWWPTSAVEDRTRRLTANQSLASVFAEAFPFPSPPAASPDPDGVPTLTQLLGGRVDQNQGLLDSFHDLNKMIVQRYKRASGVSRDLLLKTLHLQPPPQQQQQTESRPAPWTAHRRLSPGLPSANQHAQNAAAKRRLSYDYNRNVTE